MAERIPYFIDSKSAPTVEQPPGVITAVLTGLHGEDVMMVITIVQPGHEVPTHSHPEAQYSLVQAGRARAWIGEEEREVGRGDVMVMPGDVDHGAACLGDQPFVTLNVFHPIRESYIAALRGEETVIYKKP